MKKVSLTKLSTRCIDENDPKNDFKNKEIIDKVNQHPKNHSFYKSIK